MKNIKLHDTVCIISTHTDPAKTYYGSKYQGVVIEKNENEVTITKADGESETFNFSEKGDYTYSISELSEIEFTKAIEKTIANQEREVIKETEKLADMKRWQQIYKHDVSLLGRLYKFVKTQF